MHIHWINVFTQTYQRVYPAQRVLFTWSKALDLLIPLQDNGLVMVRREHVNYATFVVAIVIPDTVSNFSKSYATL